MLDRIYIFEVLSILELYTISSYKSVLPLES